MTIMGLQGGVLVRCVREKVWQSLLTLSCLLLAFLGFTSLQFILLIIVVEYVFLQSTQWHRVVPFTSVKCPVHNEFQQCGHVSSCLCVTLQYCVKMDFYSNCTSVSVASAHYAYNSTNCLNYHQKTSTS